jgi:hypothetical protein
MPYPNPALIGLGIQQPWAELILRGIKTVEIRRVPTQIRGTVYLYASRRVSPLECAAVAIREFGLPIEELPRGVIVGTVDLKGCQPADPADARAACVSQSMTENHYSWFLEGACRFQEPLQTRYVPFGMWFYPFRRKSTQPRRRRGHGGI